VALWPGVAGASRRPDQQQDSARQESSSADHQSKANAVVRKEGTSHDDLIADPATVDSRPGDRRGHTSDRDDDCEK
jgi:hypothetical protein